MVSLEITVRRPKNKKQIQPHLSIVIIHAIVLRNLIQAKNCGDILLDYA